MWNPKCNGFLALFGVLMVLGMAPEGRAQTITLTPNQVPNGITAAQDERYRQRFDITLGGTAVEASRAFTITVPSELTVTVSSVTATSFSSSIAALFAGSPSSSRLAFGVSNLTTAGGGESVANQKVTVEFDVTTVQTFSGIPNGGKRDTSYIVTFSSTANQSNTNVRVSKHQNRRVQIISFSTPDSVRGDTTEAGGRFIKLGFPAALPDLSHTGISGLSNSPGFSDNQTDVLYSFYLSQDSTLIERPLLLQPLGFRSLMDAPPLAGSRQRPRVIPATFIRENFTTAFADSVEGVVSLENTSDDRVYYVYAAADPAPGRNNYDPTRLAGFTGGVFLGRSGPLLVRHPPEFVIVGWDYDTDGGDDFSSTGVIQVPSDIPGMPITDANRKDNRNITVDSGAFFARGDALSSFNSGLVPGPASSVDLLYVAQDVDNPRDFRMNIFLSQQSSLGVGDLVGAGIDSLQGAIRLVGSDTLDINDHVFTFTPVVRDTVTQLIERIVPAASYFVYFAATDGAYRTVAQVQDDPFASSSSAALLTVQHSPNMTPDAFALNDFDGDGDLDVITGIDLSQMQTDGDGRDLHPGPARRFVTFSWGAVGMDGDLDVDDDATIDLFFSTLSNFRTVGGSAAYTNGNSTGADLLSRIPRGDNDTHQIISGLREDRDGQFDNQYAWDLWTYVSSENTVPRTDTRYYVYAIMTGGTTRRLISLTQAGGASQALNFQHPPYIQPVEPTRDMTVTVDEPVVISWNAMDVDNGGIAGVAAPNAGLAAPNSRTSSPNIRILLTSADFGAVATWASITSANNVHRFWVGNSGDGSLAEEVELNEGVDTSFVMVGHTLRNNLFASTGGGSSGALELQTRSGVGATYFVYLAIDSGFGATGASANVGNQPTNFGPYSPLVRAPGRITFTGTVPTNPPTSVRFVMPALQNLVANQEIKFPISADDGSKSGRTMRVVDLFLTVDADKFEAIDLDPGTEGIQPFNLGANSQLNESLVQQTAFVDGDKLRLDFIYDDNAGTGLTFFDGRQPLAFANLRVKSLSGGIAVNTTISLDNSGNRQTKMLDGSLANAGAFVPQPTRVNISRRAQLFGTVPLQGRTVSADTVTFMLRRVGESASVADSLFNLNDIDPVAFGVQVVSTGVNGDFALQNVPEGLYVLTASVPRHLTGHDTLLVVPGQDLFGLQPTLDGQAVDRAALLAGDAAGYTDSTGASLPDNVIGPDDINAINAALFSRLGEPDYGTFADINRDSIVNATDKDYATANQTSNTGQAGKIKPVFPTFKRTVPDGDNTRAVVVLSGLPEGEVRAGEAFDVTVEVSGTRAVRTYEVHLGYDPALLAFEDLVSGGSLLAEYSTDMSGKVGKGEVGLVNSILGRTQVGASGTGSLGTIRFRAISRGGEARLEVREATLIDVDHAGVHPRVSGGATVVLSGDMVVYHDAEGREIRSLILPGADPRVDFNDFLVLAGCFGSRAGEPGFDLRADLNADDGVGFADFLIFTEDFGRVAVDAPSSNGAAKPAAPEGVNSEAQIFLKAAGDAPQGGAVELTATLSRARAVRGWGVTVRFDPGRCALLNARAAGDAASPLFLVHQDGPGQVSLAGAVGGGTGVLADGSLATLNFRVEGTLEEAGFEVLEGVVFDPDHRTNSVGMARLRIEAEGPSEARLLPDILGSLRPLWRHWMSP